MTFKEKFSYGVLAIDLIIFVGWPFLVFFPFMIAGFILFAISGFFGIIFYSIFKASSSVEHKAIHHENVEKRPN